MLVVVDMASVMLLKYSYCCVNEDVIYFYEKILVFNLNHDWIGHVAKDDSY